MNIKMLFAVMLLAFSLQNNAVFAGEGHQHAGEAKHKAPYEVIDAEKLQKMQAENANLLIIDSRGGKYFDGTVIKGAKNLSAKETNSKTLAEIAPDKAAPIVFYCTNVDCPASKIAAYKAEKAGYTKLYKYPGGVEEWIKKGYETEKL